MKTLTPQQIMDLKPCRGYDLERLEKLFGNKESVTYLEILNTDKIPLEDIIWVFCQPTVLDKDIRNQWLEVIVTRAIKTHALHCSVDDVEKWAENWLNGDDRTVVAARAAGYAARTATNAAHAAAYNAYNAAHVAAYNAAHAAAGYANDNDAAHAAGAAAYAAGAAAYAADAAARAAVNAANTGYDAAYAARKTERKQQIQDLKNIL